MNPCPLAAVPMRFIWDLAIPMDDGVELRANVFLPQEEGAYPVIMSMTAYAKDLPFSQGYPDAWKAVLDAAPEVAAGTSTKYISFEAVDPEKWVVHGYAIVVMDARGVGRSPGVIDTWSAREARDFAIAIDWVAKQPWCNGNVGTLGMSYLAYVQWICANQQPKHLKGMIPWEGPDDHLRALGYNGGIPSSFMRHWVHSQVKAVQHGRGSRGPRNEFTGQLICGDEDLTQEQLEANIKDIYQQVMQHPLDDGFYDGRRADWSKINVPLLSVTTWGAVGSHLRGNFEGFLNAASREKWLVTRSSHGTFAAFYSNEGLTLQRKFFDYTLKGIGDFARTQPKLELAVRSVDDRIIDRRAEHEWPLERTRWTKLYLRPADFSLDTAPPQHEARATYRAFSKGVTFLTPPLTAQTEITGPLAAKLWVSSTTIDADLFLVVRVFDEQGREKLFHGLPDPRIPLTQGWLRASQRELDPARTLPFRPFLSHKNVRPLWPGEVYELDVEIWPTCVVIPAGYRIGLTILGRDFEHDAEPFVWTKAGVTFRGSSFWLHDDERYRPREIYDNEVTLWCGGNRPSHLLLPIIP